MADTSGSRAALRVAAVVAAAVVLAGLAYWRVQSSSGDATGGQTVLAGGPAETHSTGVAAQPGNAQSEQLPPENVQRERLQPEKASQLRPQDTSAPSAGEPAETADSLENATAEALQSVVVDREDAKSGGGSSAPAPDKGTDFTEGQSFTWFDGDRTRRVWIDAEHVVPSAGSSFAPDDVVAGFDGGVIVRTDAGKSGSVSGDPVFRSESGALMALPGGVVLVFEAGKDAASIDAFFAANQIDSSAVTPLDYLPNAYFIETPTGIESLRLANSLAVQDGVEVSSPNWWVERAAK